MGIFLLAGQTPIVELVFRGNRGMFQRKQKK